MKTQTETKVVIAAFAILMALALLLPHSIQAQNKTVWKIDLPRYVQVVPADDTTDSRFTDRLTIRVWNTGIDTAYAFIAATPTRRDTFYVRFIEGENKAFAYYECGEMKK